MLWDLASLHSLVFWKSFSSRPVHSLILWDLSSLTTQMNAHVAQVLNPPPPPHPPSPTTSYTPAALSMFCNARRGPVQWMPPGGSGSQWRHCCRLQTLPWSPVLNLAWPEMQKKMNVAWLVHSRMSWSLASSWPSSSPDVMGSGQLQACPFLHAMGLASSRPVYSLTVQELTSSKPVHPWCYGV